MSDISKIKVSGVEYDIKDSQAREDLDSLDDRVTYLEEHGGGLTTEAKAALLNCFAHTAWADEHGQNYYDALAEALDMVKHLVSISAVFTQGATVVYPSTALDSLKTMLVVTATYDDSTTAVVNGYTLSGVLAEGTSTIIATYQEKTATFTVNVTAEPIIPVIDYITAVYSGGDVAEGTALDALKANLVVTAHYTDDTTQTVASTDYTLSGTLAVGTSVVTVSYEGKTTTFNVTVLAQDYVLWKTIPQSDIVHKGGVTHNYGTQFAGYHYVQPRPQRACTPLFTTIPIDTDYAYKFEWDSSVPTKVFGETYNQTELDKIAQNLDFTQGGTQSGWIIGTGQSFDYWQTSPCEVRFDVGTLAIRLGWKKSDASNFGDSDLINEVRIYRKPL